MAQGLRSKLGMVSKRIPVGEGKMPKQVIKKRKDLKKKDPEKMYKRRMKAIERDSAYIGSGAKRASEQAKDAVRKDKNTSKRKALGKGMLRKEAARQRKIKEAAY